MNCAECGGDRVMVERNAVIRYDMGGLPNIVLRGVERSRCEQCGKESVRIPRNGQLHRVIADYLIQQKRQLAGDEIRFLRKHMGFSAEDFAGCMGVSRESVSRWETGAEHMGAISDRLLRTLVTTHQPTKNYLIDDLLKSLPRKLPESSPAPVEVTNERDGWEAPVAVAA